MITEEDLRQIKPWVLAWVLAWLAAYPGPWTALDQPLLDAEMQVNASLANGSIQFYLDLGTDTLRVRVRYPSGALKTGQVTLT